MYRDSRSTDVCARYGYRVAERLALSDPASIGIPSIVLHELRYGMLRARGRHPQARLELDRAGQQIGPFDIREFGRIPNLRIEDRY